MDDEKDPNKCAHLRETFDSLAERIDVILPDSGRAAFDAWRDITTFITEHKGPIPMSSVENAQACFAEVMHSLKSANITTIP